MDLPELTSISRLHVKPGDVVVISCPEKLTWAVVDTIAERLKAHLPEGIKVMVLDSGMTLDVVTPDTAADRLVKSGYSPEIARRIVSE